MNMIFALWNAVCHWHVTDPACKYSKHFNDHILAQLTSSNCTNRFLMPREIKFEATKHIINLYRSIGKAWV